MKHESKQRGTAKYYCVEPGEVVAVPKDMKVIRLTDWDTERQCWDNEDNVLESGMTDFIVGKGLHDDDVQELVEWAFQESIWYDDCINDDKLLP